MDTQYDSNIQHSEQKDKGFTLVELLIVIVILGILATVTVFAVSGITDRGKNSACKADYKTVEVAVESYYAENGAYPDSIDDLVPGYMRTAPTTYTVGTGGAITAISGNSNGCT